MVVGKNVPLGLFLSCYCDILDLTNIDSLERAPTIALSLHATSLLAIMHVMLIPKIFSIL